MLVALAVLSLAAAAADKPPAAGNDGPRAEPIQGHVGAAACAEWAQANEREAALGYAKTLQQLDPDNSEYAQLGDAH